MNVHCFNKATILYCEHHVLPDKLRNFQARSALTVQRMEWYFINIRTILMVPLAISTSLNDAADFLPVLRNRLGAIIIATLFKSILFSFRLLIIWHRNNNRSLKIKNTTFRSIAHAYLITGLFPSS